LIIPLDFHGLSKAHQTAQNASGFPGPFALSLDNPIPGQFQFLLKECLQKKKIAFLLLPIPSVIVLTSR